MVFLDMPEPLEKIPEPDEGDRPRRAVTATVKQRRRSRGR